MIDARPWTRRRIHRVDAWPFPHAPGGGPDASPGAPDASRRAFAASHGGPGQPGGPGSDVVAAAARQWFRIGARRPRAALFQPSVAVEGFCAEFSRHADYARFCDEAFGRPRPHVATSFPALAHPTDGPVAALLRTLRLARRDEPDAPGRLPLLFRVDHELAVPGGREYLAGCGGRLHCRNRTDAICLRHLTADDSGGGWTDPGRPDGGASPDAGCGGGCGGGGG